MLRWAPRDRLTAGDLPAAAATAVAAGLKLDIHRDLWAVRRVWEAFEIDAVSTPFQSWPWLAAWCTSGGSVRVRSVVVVLGYEADALKLVMPLARERRFGMCALTWLGQDISDYNAPLIEEGLLRRLKPAEAGEILLAVATALGGVDCLRLEKQPERLGDAANPFALFNSRSFTCSAHAAHLTGSWESFLAARRSRKSTRRLKEKTNSLAKHGPIVIEEIEAADERRAIVAELAAWKSAQLEARGSRNPFRNGALGNFLVEAAASPGFRLVRIHALKVGGELAAGVLGLLLGRSYIYYLAAYDWDRFARFSPGAILLTRLMEEMHAKGLEVFDFSNGDEGYKDGWCDSTTELTVTLKPLTLAGRAGFALDEAWLSLVRSIKGRPQLFAALRSLVSRVRALRGKIGRRSA